MPTTTRAQQGQGKGHIAQPPQTDLKAVAKAVSPSFATSDIEEDFEDPTDSVYIEAAAAAISKSGGKAATRKRGKGPDNTAFEQAGEVKKPKTTSSSPGFDEYQGCISELNAIFAQKDQAVKEADDRSTTLQLETETTKRELAKQQREYEKLNNRLRQAHSKDEQQTKKLKKMGKVEKQLTKSQDQYAIMESKNRKLETTIQKESERAEYFREQLLEASANDKPDYGDPDKVTDDAITARWGYICHHVETIATACTRDPFRGTELAGASPTLNLLVQQCKRSSHLANCLVQRFIWQRLCSEVFQARNGIWGGRFGEVFIEMIGKMRDLEKGNEVNLSLVSRMKHKTAKDIEFEIGLSYDALEKSSAKLFEDLSTLPNLTEWSMVPGTSSVRENLLDLFDEAAELMVVFATSRAIFTINVDCLRPHGGTCPYDPETMEIHFRHGYWDGSDQGVEVDFLLSPSLEKIGTADGGRFESRLVLRKALAVAHQKLHGVVEAMDENTHPREQRPGHPQPQETIQIL